MPTTQWPKVEQIKHYKTKKVEVTSLCDVTSTFFVL